MIKEHLLIFDIKEFSLYKILRYNPYTSSWCIFKGYCACMCGVGWILKISQSSYLELKSVNDNHGEDIKSMHFKVHYA